MDAGEFLTRSTVWISIAFYTIGCLIFATGGTRPKLDYWTRLAFSAAVVALIAHYLSAFNFYHHWSHESAYVETTRQTAEVYKIDWGGGIFINYALLMLWIADVGSWWMAGLGSYRRRPSWILLTWHGFLVFILFNATVVFKDGITRWVGLLVCAIVSLSWLIIITKNGSTQHSNK
jgi:hypothetical protein